MEQSNKHEDTTKKKGWKSIDVRMLSEQKRAKLYAEWLRIHHLCATIGFPAQSGVELTRRYASLGRSEPPRDEEIPF